MQTHAGIYNVIKFVWIFCPSCGIAEAVGIEGDGTTRRDWFAKLIGYGWKIGPQLKCAGCQYYDL